MAMASFLNNIFVKIGKSIAAYNDDHLFYSKYLVNNPIYSGKAAGDINSELLSLILEHADICQNIGSGYEYLSVSRSALKSQEMRDIFRDYIHLVCGITIQWSPATASIVAVIHNQGGTISIN